MAHRVSRFRIGDGEFAVVSYEPRARRIENLTPAEEAVLEGLLRGLRLRDLAARRGRSRATVNHQVEAIYRKLGVRSRAELVVFCTTEKAQAPDKEKRHARRHHQRGRKRLRPRKH